MQVDRAVGRAGNVVGRRGRQDRANQLPFLILALPPNNDVLSFLKAVLDLSQLRSLEAHLDGPLTDMVLAVDDVNDFLSAAQDERLHRDGKHVLNVPELQLGVRVHPGIDRQIFIGNVDLRFHGSGFEIYAAREANNFSCKGTTQCIHANLQLIANLDVFHGVFRHRHAQSQQTTLGELYDRQGLIV